MLPSLQGKYYLHARVFLLLAYCTTKLLEVTPVLHIKNQLKSGVSLMPGIHSKPQEHHPYHETGVIAFVASLPTSSRNPCSSGTDAAAEPFLDKNHDILLLEGGIKYLFKRVALVLMSHATWCMMSQCQISECRSVRADFCISECRFFASAIRPQNKNI